MLSKHSRSRIVAFGSPSNAFHSHQFLPRSVQDRPDCAILPQSDLGRPVWDAKARGSPSLPPGSTVLNDAGKPIDISLGRQGKAVGSSSNWPAALLSEEFANKSHCQSSSQRYPSSVGPVRPSLGTRG